jgi:hypothetical protein
MTQKEVNMPNSYNIFLGPGRITNRDGIYRGSDHNAVIWSPANPSSQGGWQDGDTLTASITIDVNPDVTPQPGAREYVGLCIGACSASDTGAVSDLISEAEGIITPNVGELVGDHISTSASKSDSAIFYQATSVTHDVTLHNGEVLENYITSWTMTYNGDNTAVSGGDDVEIVFGYGDPQEADNQS